MRVVQCLSHSIESYDMLRLYARLGIEAFDIGGYIDPQHPHDDKRPAIPEAPFFPEFKAAVDRIGTNDPLGSAQEHIPDELLDWLGDDGAIVFHHYLERLIGDWPRIRDWMRGAPGRRVIWRTVGQSVEHNELVMAPLRRDGLEIVRYSPKERNIPGYAGEDALIRFYKDPADYGGWHGESAFVTNFTQDLYGREPYTNWRFWDLATQGLPRMPYGPNSEVIGGGGSVSYDQMRDILRQARCYLYTGTQPASYTLGLIEAMMTGIPVVSIGPSWMRVFPYGHLLFEGHELATAYAEDPARAHESLRSLLAAPDIEAGVWMRELAIARFGIDVIAPQWASFLGVRVPEAVAA